MKKTAETWTLCPGPERYESVVKVILREARYNISDAVRSVELANSQSGRSSQSRSNCRKSKTIGIPEKFSYYSKLMCGSAVLVFRAT